MYQNPAGPVFDPREKDRQVMSVSDWFVTQLLMIIPLVNLILLLVWALPLSCLSGLLPCHVVAPCLAPPACPAEPQKNCFFRRNVHIRRFFCVFSP